MSRVIHIPFFFAIFVSFPTLEAKDLLNRACNQTMYKDTCFKTLGNTTAKDMKSLATDALKAVVKEGETALTKIEAAKKFSKGSILDHLNTCAEIYTSTNDHSSEALKLFEASKINDAIIELNTAMRVQRSCDDLFKKNNLKNPVDELHPFWVKQSNVALTICTIANPDGASVSLPSP